MLPSAGDTHVMTTMRNTEWIDAHPPGRGQMAAVPWSRSLPRTSCSYPVTGRPRDQSRPPLPYRVW